LTVYTIACRDFIDFLTGTTSTGQPRNIAKNVFYKIQLVSVSFEKNKR